MNARRAASCDRPFVALDKVLRDVSRCEPKPGISLDGTASGGRYRTDKGDTSCASDLLSEVAFDALGAARFLQGGNLGFAKEAVRSALDELSAVAVKLGVR